MLFYIALTLFVFVCLFMILLVLIQKGRGGGLASAFGGAGGNTAFGSKTGDVLTWTTSVVFGVFLLLAVALNLIANSTHAKNMGALGLTPPPTAPATAGDSKQTPALPSEGIPVVLPPTTAPAGEAVPANVPVEGTPATKPG